MALYFAPDRRRQRAARALALNADSAAVLRTMGPRPTRCPPGRMEHLRGALGVDEMAADSAMVQLRRGTRQRWIYPGARGCAPGKGETELGIDAAGRLLWIQPAAENSTVRLSPRIMY